MSFDIDLSELEQLFKRLNPKHIRQLESNYINTLLFRLRTYTLKDKDGIKDEFTIRNKGLVRKTIRVTKTNRNNLTGYYGSVPTARFTGWSEQQYGKQPKRQRVAMRRARGPGGRRRIPKRFRLNQTIRSSKNVKLQGTSEKQRIAIFLSANRRRGYTGPLIVHEKGPKNMPPGVYNMLKSSKLRLIQVFKQMEVEHNPWATDIIKRYMAQERHGLIITKEIHRLMSRKN